MFFFTTNIQFKISLVLSMSVHLLVKVSKFVSDSFFWRKSLSPQVHYYGIVHFHHHSLADRWLSSNSRSKDKDFESVGFVDPDIRHRALDSTEKCRLTKGFKRLFITFPK